MTRTRWIGSGIAIVILALAAVLATGVTGTATTNSYTPQTRDFTVVGAPTMVHEMQDSLDFLKTAFAPGGVLDGKEVFSFAPSTLVVYQGDTVNLTLVNPSDDPHTFTIGELNVNTEMPGQSSVSSSFVAGKVGIYTYLCAEPEHMPYMWGQLIVLPDPAAS